MTPYSLFLDLGQSLYTHIIGVGIILLFAKHTYSELEIQLREFKWRIEAWVNKPSHHHRHQRPRFRCQIHPMLLQLATHFLHSVKCYFLVLSADIKNMWCTLILISWNSDNALVSRLGTFSSFTASAGYNFSRAAETMAWSQSSPYWNCVYMKS